MRKCRWKWGAAGKCQIGGDWHCYGYDVCPAYEPRRKGKGKTKCESGKSSTGFWAWRWACALFRWLRSSGRRSAPGTCGTRRTTIERTPTLPG